MDFNFYQKEFESLITKISKHELENQGLEISVDVVMESVAIKIYKPEWSDNSQSPLHASSRIFFSIWINDKAIEQNKLYYNIHALKLRQLKGYKISSRNFAEKFRENFSEYQNDWPNVSTEYGPLTLMQGWIELNPNNIENDIFELIQKFFKIDNIIDSVLENYKI